MAQPALNGGKIEHEASDAEPLDQRLLIPLGISLKTRIKDYRFDTRQDSIAAAVRYLLEAGLKAEAWRTKKPS